MVSLWYLYGIYIGRIRTFQLSRKTFARIKVFVSQQSDLMHIARLDAQKRENKRWKIWFTLEKLVTLHSQIRDGNRSMSDNPYLFRAS